MNDSKQCLDEGHRKQIKDLHKAFRDAIDAYYPDSDYDFSSIMTALMIIIADLGVMRLPLDRLMRSINMTLPIL